MSERWVTCPRCGAPFWLAPGEPPPSHVASPDPRLVTPRLCVPAPTSPADVPSAPVTYDDVLSLLTAALGAPHDTRTSDAARVAQWSTAPAVSLSEVAGVVALSTHDAHGAQSWPVTVAGVRRVVARVR